MPGATDPLVDEHFESTFNALGSQCGNFATGAGTQSPSVGDDRPGRVCTMHGRVFFGHPWGVWIDRARS